MSEPAGREGERAPVLDSEAPLQLVWDGRFRTDGESGGVLSDLALMERVRDGDEEAYGVLLGRHWSSLVAFAEGIVGEDTAQDVAQEAFIRVWKGRDRWVATSSVSAYLFHITRNLALNARRNLLAERARREKAGRGATSSSTRSDPGETLAARRLQEAVEAAIQALPERRRQAFILSRFHHLSYQEIAEVMGIATQTVANQMRAALAELRESLAPVLNEE